MLQKAENESAFSAPGTPNAPFIIVLIKVQGSIPMVISTNAALSINAAKNAPIRMENAESLDMGGRLVM